MTLPPEWRWPPLPPGWQWVPLPPPPPPEPPEPSVSRFTVSMIVIGVLLAGCSIAAALGIVFTGGIKAPPYTDDRIQPAETALPTQPESSDPGATGSAGQPTAEPSGSAVTPSARPAPTSTAGPGTRPQYATCEEAIAAGEGNYVRGRDPQYPWYVDEDSDGVACER